MQPHPRMRPIAALVLGASLWACRPPVLETALEVSAPLVVGSHMAYLDRSRARITLVRPARREILHFWVGQRPRELVASPDQQWVLVLCRGWDGSPDAGVQEPPSLHAVNLASGRQLNLDVDAPYDGLAISDDGHHAVAYFSEGSLHDSTEVFRNPNAIAVIDLTTGTVQTKSVRSFGAVPRGVAFSPSSMAPLTVDGGVGTPRTLGAVLANGYLTLVDIEHVERSEVTVRLSLPGSEVAIVPREVVFAPGAGALYVLADGSDDIYVLNLTAREPTSARENDFVVSVSSLAAGSQPGDLALFSEAGRDKVLVANRGSGDLSVVDAATAQFVTIPVGEPVDRILVYPQNAPTLALVYCVARPRRAVFVLELAEVESRLGRNLSQLEGDDPVQSLQWIPGGPRALAVHTAGSTAMSIIDVDGQSMFPMTSQGKLVDFSITLGGTLLAGAVVGQRQLGLIDLDSLATRTLALDQEAAHVLTLHPGGAGADAEEAGLVVVDHGSQMGRMTVIRDSTLPAQQGFFVLQGYLLQGILDDRYPN